MRGTEGEKGQAIVLMALLMSAMLLIVALAVDTGLVYSEHRTQREAVDAAAWAGATVLYLSGTIDSAAQTNARSAALADAAKNGFTNGVGGVTVTASTPPLTGAFANNAKYIEVTITRSVRTILMNTQGGSAATTVTTRSVAGSAPIASPYAIALLEPGPGPCLTVLGSGGITVPSGPDLGGAIQANCTGTSVSLATKGGGVNDPLGVFTVGTVDNPSKVTPAGALRQNQPVQRDPFAGFPKPPDTPVVWAGPSPYPIPAAACDSEANALEPGVYVGGILNNLAATCDVYLKTGVFIMKGGGFNQNAANPSTIRNVTGGGVMLFNTHSKYPAPKGTGTCGQIKADQGGAFKLKGMTQAQSPNYYGMVLYQDAACSETIYVASNGGLDLEGTLYAPSATLDIQAQSSVAISAQLVLRAITMESSGTLNVNYRPSTSASSAIPAIVE